MQDDRLLQLKLLNQVLVAAEEPCPQPTDYSNARSTPWVIDPLIHELERPEVNATVRRHLTRPEEFSWPWWGYGGLGQGYEEDRARTVERIKMMRYELASECERPPGMKAAEITFAEALAAGVSRSTLYRCKGDGRKETGARQLSDAMRTTVFNRKKLQSRLRRTGAIGLES